MGVATFAGGAVLGVRPVFAQQATAMLGHFGSANPQTFGKATGSFQKALGANVKVDYVTVSAGPQIIAAMAGNSMDICNIGSSAMVAGFAQNLPISMVYVQKYITDSECMAVRNDAGIASLKDLKGRKIGLPFNTSVHFATLAALRTVGLGVADVTLINLRPDSILATWRRKEIDAAFIWHPVLGDLVKENGRILFTSGELVKHGTLVYDGIIVRNTFKEKQPDLVLSYLKEYDRICNVYKNNQDEVVKVMSSFLQLAPEKTVEYIKTFHSLTPKEILSDTWMGAPGAKDTGVLKTMADQAQLLKAAGQINSVPASFAQFVDSSFVARMV
jgi:taurine transport system substrate-binding protein